MIRSKQKRKLIRLETYTTGTGIDQTFGCKSTLPMDGANAVESENAAARIMQAVNAQLNYSGSDLRLMLYDIKKRRVVRITFPERGST